MHLSTKGMAIHIHGHPDVLLEFFNKQHRDMVRRVLPSGSGPRW
jgi:hypothetical protein